jgi:hypothetical protein
MNDEKAKAEQKLIDEAARIAREVGATPEMVDAAIAADRRVQSDEKPSPGSQYLGDSWIKSDGTQMQGREPAAMPRDERPRPSPGPWRWRKHRDEVDGMLEDATGRGIIAPSIYDGVIIEPADAALIADAWQLPQLRELLDELASIAEQAAQMLNVVGITEADGPVGRARALLDEKKGTP